MAKKKLVLMVSKRMDTNKKKDRNENVLVRMSAETRGYLGLHGDKVELWQMNATGEERLNKSILLSVFKAFSEDLKGLKNNPDITQTQQKCVGFVTTKIFNRICGGSKEQVENIWISDDIQDTVIGTDPEFLLFDSKNKLVPAHNILTYNITPKAGSVGSDGPLAEIRPKPEVSVKKLVKNMTDILKANEKNPKICELSWIASCYHKDPYREYPVGGHIHVGNPKQLMTKSYDIRNEFYRVLNKILDEYLAIPLVKLDGKDGGLRRNNGYGGFGQFRTDLGRLEHRTLSGIWMLHPDLALIVLGTARAVIGETFKLAAASDFDLNYVLSSKYSKENIWGPQFDGWRDIPLAIDMKCTTSSKKMIEVLKNSDEKYMTVQRINNLHKRLKTLSTYKENSIYIDGFCEILKVEFNEFQKYSRSIQENWLSKKKFIVSV